jgi:hypothetical protein
MRRGIGLGVGIAALFLLTTCGRDPSPSAAGPGTTALLTIGVEGGRVEFGALALDVPAGALDHAVNITVRELEDAPWGAVGPAYDFGPDGLTFRIPAKLQIRYDADALPPGTDPQSLRLSVLEGGRWRGLPGHANRSGDQEVAGLVQHFSTYGVVPDPREVDGRGTRWEANGVVVQSSREMFGRLFVSPTAVSMFVEPGGVPSVSLDFAGLPTDEANHLYVDDYSTHIIVEPSAGGVARVSVDGSEPHYLWLQPSPGTVLIGGPADGCAAVGVRTGDTCTLTTDVFDGVSIEAARQVLDCAGHRIRQAPVKGGTSIGILVSGFQRPMDHVKIRNCVVGGAGVGFFQAIDVANAPDVEIADSVFEDNMLGIYVQKTARPRVFRNSFSGGGNYALQFYDGTTDGEIANNRIAIAGGIQPTAMMFKGGDPAIGGTPVDRMSVHGNSITGGDIGMRFIAATDQAITENEIAGAGHAIWLGTGGWPLRFWWNDIHDWTAWAVWSELGPAELSDAGRGNWWGKLCPDPLFAPGVDSNRPDVTDTFPYGERDAWTLDGTPGCPSDGDGDRIPDDLDNCPTVANTYQENADGVGEGDACDHTAPSPPVLELPAESDYIGGVLPFFRGTAEPASNVTVKQCATPVGCAGCAESCWATGLFRADAEGVFVGPARVLPAPGPQRAFAFAVDAAGNTSATSASVHFDFGQPQVDRPVLTAPADHSVATALPIQVTGWAPRRSRVALLSGGAPVGETVALDDGATTY